MIDRGKFIVIEGTDGSGKGTHTNLLVEWLKSTGYDVHSLDFPRYGEPSAYFVEQYLTGAYGKIRDTDSYRGSLFYALDRFAAAPEIHSAIAAGKIVICNRYVGSNMGHQGAKISDKTQRQSYFEWNNNLEFNILGLPKPNLNIVLRMPAKIAQQFVDSKGLRSYTLGQKRDLHEADLSHLEQAAQTYDELCALFPNDFVKLDCYDGQAVRTIEAVQADIRELVKHQLGV